jgi:hypothetical protein
MKTPGFFFLEGLELLDKSAIINNILYAVRQKIVKYIPIQTIDKE